MKVKKVLIVLILISLIASGCSVSSAQNNEILDKKPVKVMEVKEEEAVSRLTYMGIVTPKEVKKLGFKSPGEIKSINVTEGQRVKKGQVLATIDTKDLGYSVDAAKAAKDAATAQYDKALKGATEEDIVLAKSNVNKAESAYSFAKDNYERAKKLYDAGGLSKHEIEGAKLELDIREEELSAAKTLLSQVEKGARKEDLDFLRAQISQANTDLNYKTNLVKDGVMVSDMDGYVMTLLAKTGEITGAGYPIIVMGSGTNIVKFGLTPEDASKIDIGIDIEVEISGEIYKGKITSIDKIMDEETRTYTVRGEIEDSALPSGAIVRVSIPTGKYNAIAIPLTSVMNGSFDYVYIIENDLVKKKQIELGDIKGDKVEVRGLDIGDILVVEGMKKINDGEPVEIIK